MRDLSVRVCILEGLSCLSLSQRVNAVRFSLIIFVAEDHCNVPAGGEVNTSASSTSSASLDQQECSGKQGACGGDTSPLLYPSRLKIHAAKIALNSGKEHMSPSGQVRRARQLKHPCHSNCKRCQLPRLTTAERLLIFDHFWSLKSHEKQWLFISNAVSVSRPQKKVAVPGSKGAKSCSRVYYLTNNGRKTRVCKIMFKHTLSICDSWIDSALSHVPLGLPDLRGKCKTE